MFLAIECCLFFRRKEWNQFPEWAKRRTWQSRWRSSPWTQPALRPSLSFAGLQELTESLFGWSKFKLIFHHLQLKEFWGVSYAIPILLREELIRRAVSWVPCDHKNTSEHKLWNLSLPGLHSQHSFLYTICLTTSPTTGALKRRGK